MNDNKKLQYNIRRQCWYQPDIEIHKYCLDKFWNEISKKRISLTSLKRSPLALAGG